MDKRKILGVLGGLGPMSSVYFYELVTENTKASKDQEHLDIVISSRATTPDRTDYILGLSQDNPLVAMEEEAKKLVEYGATTLALTCNTAHYFYENLQAAISVPLLNIGELAVKHIKNLGIKKAGLLATSGTVNCGIYQTACGDKGIECLVPSEDNQRLVMDIIYSQVKSGIKVDMDEFKSVAAELANRGAEVIILGCTELSLIKRNENLDDRFVDPLEILAKASILACGHQLADDADGKNIYSVI